nr:hypothetical protein [Tanacetum cinerariifolium]
MGRMEEDVTDVKEINAVEPEPTVFDDEEVTMTMAQTLIKIKAEKARILDEQMENIDWNVVAEQMQEKHLDNIKNFFDGATLFLRDHQPLAASPRHLSPPHHISSSNITITSSSHRWPPPSASTIATSTVAPPHHHRYPHNHLTTIATTLHYDATATATLVPPSSSPHRHPPHNLLTTISTLPPRLYNTKWGYVWLCNFALRDRTKGAFGCAETRKGCVWLCKNVLRACLGEQETPKGVFKIAENRKGCVWASILQQGVCLG